MLGPTCLSTLRHAVSVRKYRCGTLPVSKMSDKEDAPPALRKSKVSRVQHVPRVPVPDVAQLAKEGLEVPAAVCAEDCLDVFPHEPARSPYLRDFEEPEGEPSPSVFEASP